MRAARVLASLAILTSLAGVAHAQTGCARLSWDTCDPFVQTQYWEGGTVRLVESIYGVSMPNVGTDTQIRIDFGDAANGPVPDAWRFDAAGCQSASRLSITNQALNQSCPSMGSNALTTAQYLIDGLDALLRLTTTYDEFIPDAATRYTVWQIVFDHTYDIVGPSGGGLCGGAEKGANFRFDFAQVIEPGGHRIDLGPCDVNQFFYCGYVTWMGGAYYPEAGGGCGSIPILPATWGRVRATYR